MRYPIEGTSKDNGTILYCNFAKVETTTLPSKEVWKVSCRHSHVNKCIQAIRHSANPGGTEKILKV